MSNWVKIDRFWRPLKQLKFGIIFLKLIWDDSSPVTRCGVFSSKKYQSHQETYWAYTGARGQQRCVDMLNYQRMLPMVLRYQVYIKKMLPRPCFTATHLNSCHVTFRIHGFVRAACAILGQCLQHPEKKHGLVRPN